MQQSQPLSGIQCKDCGYQGPAKTNNSTMFLIFVGLVFLSAFFLPLIIVSLAYLVWILSRPNTKSCPQCKSLRVEEITTDMIKAAEEATIKSEESRTQG